MGVGTRVDVHPKARAVSDDLLRSKALTFDQPELGPPTRKAVTTLTPCRNPSVFS